MIIDTSSDGGVVVVVGDAVVVVCSAHGITFVQVWHVCSAASSFMLSPPADVERPTTTTTIQAPIASGNG